MTRSFKTSYMTTHLWFIVFLKETQHMYVNKYETETELLINKQVFINIYIVVTDVSARGSF